jgi:hypothetical protein
MLPFNIQEGPAGSVSGIGDLIAAWNQTIIRGEDLQLDLQAGGRFPTGGANGAVSLPQSYQSGLGSTDILLGATVVLGSFDGTLAGQIAFGRGSNSITRLKRGHDILIRSGYSMTAGQFTIHPAVLLIKRFGESSVLNPSFPPGPEFVEIPESDQLQINFAGDTSFRVSDAYSIEIGVAVPFLEREVNVDGLTRAITLKISVYGWF